MSSKRAKSESECRSGTQRITDCICKISPEVKSVCGLKWIVFNCKCSVEGAWTGGVVVVADVWELGTSG